LSSNQPAHEDSAPQDNRAGNEENSEQEDSDDASDDESGGAAGEAEPELADIERKRKLKRKAPTKTGAHRGGGTRLSREPKIRPQQRINEFPGEGWAVFNGKLFCQGCKEELSLIRSSCTHHVKTQKHISKRVAREKLLLRDANLKDDLTAYFTAVLLIALCQHLITWRIALLETAGTSSVASTRMKFFALLEYLTPLLLPRMKP